ncbi:MAG: fumarylacetoacetate hydrolase family protein [Chloroflexi bacterium]|nr:fumarylacetoacetate hydrolase family protein [Chloroflexota bacterium]
MKFATVSTLRASTQPALIVGDQVFTVPYPDMYAVMEAGAEKAASRASKESLSFEEVKFLPPLKPNTLRDGYGFERHVLAASKIRGREVPPEWYEFPVFYYTNPISVFGHEDEIPHPASTDALDFELEIAAVIGARAKDLRPERVPDHIFGYTILNDWSARDIQRQEMKVGLGPAKGKDFAYSLGPLIVTQDELKDRADERPGVYDLEMTARLNGVQISKGNLKEIHWSFGDLIARASESVELLPGDVLGSGTVGSGCLLELTQAKGPWLKPGDVVELEVERIGVLRNTIAPKR